MCGYRFNGFCFICLGRLYISDAFIKNFKLDLCLFKTYAKSKRSEKTISKYSLRSKQIMREKCLQSKLFIRTKQILSLSGPTFFMKIIPVFFDYSFEQENIKLVGESLVFSSLNYSKYLNLNITKHFSDSSVLRTILNPSRSFFVCCFSNYYLYHKKKKACLVMLMPVVRNIFLYL